MSERTPKPEADRRELAGPDFSTGFTPEQKRAFFARMRVPLVTFAALMTFLAVNLAVGWLHPIEQAWIIEAPVMVMMIVVVLLYSMEVIHDPPLVRFFSVLGFCWVAILFTMTLIDYSTR
jgi:cytochrome c oxidase subunit 4